MPFEEDPTSFVRLWEGACVATHMDIVWAVDFPNRRLVGHVDITAVAVGVGPCTLTLDCRSINVSSVSIFESATSSVEAAPEETDSADGEIGGRATKGVCGGVLSQISFSQKSTESDAVHDVLGVPLSVPLPPADNAGFKYKVRVCYETTPEGSALQWLNAPQTSSGKLPFVFSQCQAIHARSLVPCQDLCQAKVTYTLKVTAPSALTCLASAVRVKAPAPCSEVPEFSKDGAELWSVAFFVQGVPVPPYLIAFVCGELAGQSVGPISTVWAEPAVLDRAVFEFSGTHEFMKAAEALCGTYRFDVFDLLVLPPSFPYGGMENPCLTFVTPTLLAGDRSQVAVIAHELAHSWSGNLVTNKTWEHFWINEGLTVFIENKLIEKVLGAEEASIRREEGWEHLRQDVERFGEGHTFTRLCPQLALGQDPDDSFSSVPYEKGAALFWHIQDVIGVEAMERILPMFFDSFSLSTVSSSDVKNFFMLSYGEKLAPAMDWDHWLTAPGMPLSKPPTDPAVGRDAAAAAKRWAQSGGVSEAEAKLAAKWPSGKKCMLLHSLLRDLNETRTEHVLSPQAVREIGERCGFLTTNCEVRCAYVTLWLRADPASGAAMAEAERLATEQGRMKYTRPMYREMFRASKDRARDVFRSNSARYHPICAKMIARDLGVQL
jgi:leukotriene-A4 hydrolase